MTKAFFATVAIVIASTLALADGDPKRGEMRFNDCAACHSLVPGTNKTGPSHAGIFGRKAGTIADFRYSPAMRRSGITWTPQLLEEFIADPQKFVPANRMLYSGMPDAADRADLIAYCRRRRSSHPPIATGPGRIALPVGREWILRLRQIALLRRAIGFRSSASAPVNISHGLTRRDFNTAISDRGGGIKCLFHQFDAVIVARSHFFRA